MEVGKTQRILKNRMARGRDGIMNEVLKYCRIAMTEQLAEKYYNTPKYPKNRKQT